MKIVLNHATGRSEGETNPARQDTFILKRMESDFESDSPLRLERALPIAVTLIDHVGLPDNTIERE